MCFILKQIHHTHFDHRLYTRSIMGFAMVMTSLRTLLSSMETLHRSLSTCYISCIRCCTLCWPVCCCTLPPCLCHIFFCSQWFLAACLTSRHILHTVKPPHILCHLLVIISLIVNSNQFPHCIVLIQYIS